MRPAIDLSGNRFGRLIVIERAGSDLGGNAKWRVFCDCGKETIVSGCSLRYGYTKSCGCLRREIIINRNTTHGDSCSRSVSREYGIWNGMKSRCTNRKCKDFKYYGGRGIKVCCRWLDSFDNFLKDMGRCPPGLSIERKNNDGDYEPGNCLWATQSDQIKNRRVILRTKRIES